MADAARYHESAAREEQRTETRTGAAIAADILNILFGGVADAPDVRLADGSNVFDASSPRATLTLLHPAVLRDILISVSDVSAGEAFVRGDVAVDGDLESVIVALEEARSARSPRDIVRMLRMVASLWRPAPERPTQGRTAARLRGRLHSRERDRAAVEYHYNVSNQFYALWLDADMTYSCAYFRTPADSLDVAQQNKYDLIARKLRLAPGDRFLDIGCGWGGLMRFAAREYGARSVGVTLSARQAEYAKDRIQREGLADVCSVNLLDYRDLSQLGRFDKIASVGMVEHVGSMRLPDYFASAYDVLEAGGLFLNHGIVSQTQAPKGLRGFLARASGAGLRGFVGRYVFPDGDLLRLDAATTFATNAGFEVMDVENLRQHYAATLRHWVRRLEDNESSARSIVGDETYNTWRLYMAGSARGFAAGRMGVVQMLLGKRDARGAIDAPVTRADIYEPLPRSRPLG